MKNEYMIEINNVSMMFNKSSEKVDSIKEYFIKLIKRQLMFEEFWALKNVSFNVKPGETVGLVGLNGSGKSTLLKTVAGVLKPATGSIQTHGTIAPMIELGAGFDPNLTARENIYLNGAVLGYNRKTMDEKFEEIVDFSELREFLDVPVKNYSSGMQARLGFAIATATIPDILIVDEVLGVGDYRFQEKCSERMEEIMKQGTTILFVSHDIEQVKSICTRAIWLDKGKVIMDGDAETVCDCYMEE